MERHENVWYKQTKYYLNCPDARRITTHPTQWDRCYSDENSILNTAYFVVAFLANLEIIQNFQGSFTEGKVRENGGVE